MSRKSASFGQLLNYLNRDPHPDSAVIAHNLNTVENDLANIEAEFRQNACYLPRRKNGVALYHEILSFSAHDQVAPEIALDLGQEYLRLRAPEALAYGRVHGDKAALHLHLMISGNLIGSRKKLRLTKKEFTQVKRDLEAIQRERYPELAHSLVHTAQKRERLKQSRGETERARRQRHGKRRQPSEKERVRAICREQLVVAASEHDFKQRLEAQGLCLYSRGQTKGLLDKGAGKKYRLKTLGVGEDYEKAQAAWRRAPVLRASLQEIERGKCLREFAEFGFKQDILEVLNSGRDENDAPHIRERKEALRGVAVLQREARRRVERHRGRDFDC